MGYPVAYRTAAARAHRGLSNPVALVLIPPPKTGYMLPPTEWRKLAMRQITQVAPDLPLLRPWQIHQLRYGLRRLAWLHPALRIANIAWDLYDVHNAWKMQTSGIGPGWIHVCGPSTPPPPPPVDYNTDEGWRYSQIFAPWTNALCGTAGQGGPHSTATVVNINWVGAVAVKYLSGLNQLNIRRWFYETIYYKMNPEPGDESGPVQSVEQPIVLPAPHPLWRTPWVDPFVLPILQPVPTPEAPPYPAIPHRPNVDRGYDVRPDIPPQVNPNRWPSYAPRFSAGKRTKERKFKASAVTNLFAEALRVAAQVDGKLKDFRDLIGAMHDALPKEFQLKGKDKKDMSKVLAQLYRHLDKMKGDEAFLGILQEIAEDLLGGAGDRLRQEAASKNGWFKNKIFTSPRF